MCFCQAGICPRPPDNASYLLWWRTECESVSRNQPTLKWLHLICCSALLCCHSPLASGLNKVAWKIMCLLSWKGFLPISKQQIHPWISWDMPILLCHPHPSGNGGNVNQLCVLSCLQSFKFVSPLLNFWLRLHDCFEIHRFITVLAALTRQERTEYNSSVKCWPPHDFLTCCASVSDWNVTYQLLLWANSQLITLGQLSFLNSAFTSWRGGKRLFQ